jgi:hypothetical protein
MPWGSRSRHRTCCAPKVDRSKAEEKEADKDDSDRPPPMETRSKETDTKAPTHDPENEKPGANDDLHQHQHSPQ